MPTRTGDKRDVVSLGVELATTHDGLPPRKVGATMGPAGETRRDRLRERARAFKGRMGCPHARNAGIGTA
jgi:hypothetical protein